MLPVCYGDALFGMWKGFDEMIRWGWIDACPRLVAAEVSGSLSAAADQNLDMPPAVSRNSKSIANSIDVTRGTFQAHEALKRSHGCAIALDDTALVDAKNKLARTSGLSVETSSAAAFAAIDVLSSRNIIGPEDNVLAVLTASGLKDYGTSGTDRLEALEVDPSLSSVLRALSNTYGFHV